MPVLWHSAKRFKKQISLPSAGAVALGKEFFYKKNRRRRPSADGVKSLPSARTALGKAFAECPKFGTRQSSLYRKGIRWRLFAECKAAFAECNRHSAKSPPPLVTGTECRKYSLHWLTTAPPVSCRHHCSLLQLPCLLLLENKGRRER